MLFFISALFIGLGFVLTLSWFSFRNGQKLLASNNSSDFELHPNLTVLVSSQYRWGESLGIPINCNLYLNEEQLILVAARFNPFLFMTTFPVVLIKKENSEGKILRSTSHEIIFTSIQHKPSLFETDLEITIREYELSRKNELFKVIRQWCKKNE